MSRKPGQGHKVHLVTGPDVTACLRPILGPDVHAITEDRARFAAAGERATCGACRTALGLDTHATTAAAVEATLRHVAGWIAEPSDAYELTTAADRLAACDGDLTGTTACPVCEEVRCDDDCPLHGVRGALGLWSAP